MAKLIINGLIKRPRWYSIKCVCSTIENDDEHKYPLTDCEHCKFQECEDSMPRETFTINDDIKDKKGEVIKKQTKTVKEITIVRGKRFEDIIGWVY